MIASERRARLRPAAVVERWREFWFRPEPAYPLGLVRIAFGALAMAWTLSLLPGLYELFGEDGVAPRQPLRGPFRWTVFDIWTSDGALLVGWAVLLVAAIALTVGWHSRIAALLVFLLILSFDRRNPFVLNSGDVLVRIEALFLALSPCGAALSLDRRRRTGSLWSAATQSPWPLRLMQVQLSVIYLSSVQVKLTGSAWPQGTAVSYALRLYDMLILRVPQWISTDALLMNLATWGTMAIELSIGILIWNRRLRPWVLAAGVVMHTMIMITINVGFFSLAMFVLYLAFVPPESVRRLPDTIADIVTKLRTLPGRLRRTRSENDETNISPSAERVLRAPP
jgi:hypothetical protein